MENKILATLMVAMLTVSMALFGCDSKGPAEKAGERIDQTVDSAKQKIEDAADKITGQGPAEKMGEKIDETVESIKKSVETDK